MEQWQKDQDELNAIKNKYHLTWCHECDLTSVGGLLWYKPSGEFLGCIDGDEPETALSQLKQLIEEQDVQVPTYCKPLNKSIILQGSSQPGLEAHGFGQTRPDSTKFLPEAMDLKYDSMVPITGHPGAFGYKRKNHIHEGVDLYANEGDRVYSMVDGVVVAVIEDFTGPECGMPWWNKTSAVAIEDAHGVWIYGEIRVGSDIQVGQLVKAGMDIGGVLQVLKEDKGRPMAMLHLERYTKGTTESVGLWKLDEPQPENLLDPTPDLIEGLLLE